MNGIIVSTPTPYRLVATLPLTASDGTIVFQTTDLMLYVWYSGAWHAQSGIAVDGVMLSETGDYFTTEAGDYLATE